MTRFSTVTLAMVVLLTLSIGFGGPWAVAALIYISVFAYFIDRLSLLVSPDHPGQEFPAGHGLSLCLGLVHFPLLYSGIWAISAENHLTVTDKILIFLALSLFLGQVSNSNAHELIHRAQRSAHRLGVGVYCSILFGHHASAHIRVHHVFAATGKDPNSARAGEAFYAFALRAWIGGFVQGLHADRRIRRPGRLSPYFIYLLGAVTSILGAYIIAATAGVIALIALSVYAQLQLLLSDYVQHYGLSRRQLPSGKFEPVGPQHSWNAPHGFSSALMLNAPRHSDHHAHPTTPYPGLSLDRAVMPILPYPLPFMAVLALVPPLWRKVMDKRVARWTEQHKTPPIGGALPS